MLDGNNTIKAISSSLQCLFNGGKYGNYISNDISNGWLYISFEEMYASAGSLLNILLFYSQ